MNTRLLAAAVVALSLTACGGGGGGGGGGPGPVASADEAMQDIITETPDVSVADVQNTASTVSAASQAGSSLPAFGSVTQSANRDAASRASRPTGRPPSSTVRRSFSRSIARAGRIFT